MFNFIKIKCNYLMSLSYDIYPFFEIFDDGIHLYQNIYRVAYDISNLQLTIFDMSH